MEMSGWCMHSCICGNAVVIRVACIYVASYCLCIASAVAIGLLFTCCTCHTACFLAEKRVLCTYRMFKSAAVSLNPAVTVCVLLTHWCELHRCAKVTAAVTLVTYVEFVSGSPLLLLLQPAGILSHCHNCCPLPGPQSLSLQAYIQSPTDSFMVQSCGI
jgi:hypothetical protein